MNRPTTLDEWKAYIGQLSGTALFSQVVAANSQGFARTLLDEGYSMADVEEVLRIFVRQCKATGTKIPENGPFDLKSMSLVENVSETINPDELKAVPVEDDDLNRFLTMAEGE